MKKKILFSEIGKIGSNTSDTTETLQEEGKKWLDEDALKNSRTKTPRIVDSENNADKEYVQNDTGQRVTYAQMEDKIKLASLQAENNKLKEQLKTQENENKTSYMLGMKEAYEDVIKILIREGEDY